jgi:hypothetical protein
MRVADHLLDRDDPRFDRHRMGDQRDLCLRPLLVALVSGHWSAWQAARVEVNQDAETAKRRNKDIPERIVQRVVDETTLQRAEA